MIHFIPIDPGQKRTKLSQDHSHHLVNVRRETDLVRFTNGKGDLFEGQIESVENGCAVVSQIELLEHRAAPFSIHLCVSLIKRQNFELVIQKGTELGISVFEPIISQWCDVTEKNVGLNRLERINKIVVEACKQSETVYLPEVRPPQALSKALEKLENTLTICLLPNADKDFRQYLGDLDRSHVQRIRIFTGPERGFSPEDEKVLFNRGVIPLKLGSSVLKAETAAIAGAAVLRYEFLSP